MQPADGVLLDTSRLGYHGYLAPYLLIGGGERGKTTYRPAGFVAGKK